MANKDFKVKNSIVIPTPLALTEGGTGQTSATNALNALLPVQTDNTSKVLQTNGTSTSWVTLPNGFTKGNTASRPDPASVGDIYSNTQTGYIEVYTSAGWSQLGVIPLSPTIGTPTDVGTNVAYGSGSVYVAFTPGVGGGLASSFTAVSAPGSISASSSSSPIQVTGLTLGTSYTFTVTATNGYGNSLASSSSSSTTTTSIPQAPTIGTPTVSSGQSYTGSASVSVPFTAGASGGKSITGYIVTSSSGTTASGVSSPISISDTVGIARTYTVTATNTNGTSIASSASASTTPISVPQAPTIGTATALTGSTASITFIAGATGGSAITGYTVTSSPGGITATGSSPVTISGLTQNTAYTFTVTATNSSGTSAASTSSNSITTPITSLVDTFNRSTGALGISSDAASTWSVLKNNFTVDTNMAYSTSTADSLATVPLASSTITNAQIDMYSDQGGMGLAFWVTDANSYWSAYPYYTTTTNSSTVTNCTGPGGGSYEYPNKPANVCGQACSLDVYGYCAGQFNNLAGPRANCSVSAAQSTILNNNCNYDWYITYCTGNCTINATNVTNTVYTTNYTSAVRIANQSGSQHENIYASAYTPLKSLAISTSGNAITYNGYSAISKGGSVLVSSSYTPSSPTKGTKVGVFKTISQYSQGSYLDNINVTVA